MLFLEHLQELRRRTIYSIAWWIGIFLILVFFSNDLFDLFATPIMTKLGSEGKIIATEISSPFLIPLSLSLFVSLLIAMPAILYNIWTFFAPALYLREKYFARIILLSSWALFYLGIIFCYFVVLPLIFAFLQIISPHSVTIMPDISHYFSFMLKMFLIFGCVFEMPVIVIVLLATGVTTIDYLVSIRRHVIVAAFAIGMLLTPPDVVSQILLAIAIWMLYESGIGLWKLLNKTDRKN